MSDEPIVSRKVEWLYAHFQAISEASNHYLFLLVMGVAFSFGAFFSSQLDFEVPLLQLRVSRDMVLSVTTLLGTFLTVAYCGNYDKGEQTINRVADALGVQYGDLDYIDTHPNAIDFARFAPQEQIDKRSRVARFAASMLYSIALGGELAWFTFLWLYGIILYKTSTAPSLLLDIVTGPVLCVALLRGGPFIQRRWETFCRKERERKAADV